MSQYIRDIAIYGVTLFAAAVAWQVASAIYRRRREPRLPLRGKSYDSTAQATTMLPALRR